MKRRSRISAAMALTVVVVLVHARPSRGAEPAADPLASVVGRRVRVTDAGRAKARPSGPTVNPRVGTLESYDGETLTVAVEGLSEPVTIRRRDVRRFEVHVGRRSMWRKGAAIGGTLGALLGLIPAGACAASYDACADDRLTGVLFAPLVLGAIGGAVGAVAGAPVRGDHWEEVEKTRRAGWSVAPVPGGIGLSFSVLWGKKPQGPGRRR